MADDERDEEEGPGASYKSFLAMEAIIDKLKLLDYERDYCKTLHMKPLPRHYFALAVNPGEQFHNFTCLAAWLIRNGGGRMEQPQEYDDPNATISAILDEVRRHGHQVEFPPSRLKPGAGEECVRVIDQLTEAALKAKGFRWSVPQYPEEEAGEENIIEEAGDEGDSAELTLGRGGVASFPGSGEDMDDNEDFLEEEENVMDLEGLRKIRGHSAGPGGDGAQRSRPEEVLESHTDSSAWLLEVERVLPQLKVTIRSDSKDWRSHLDQMHKHGEEIAKCNTTAKTHLDRLHDELARTMEKIASREKYLSSQLEGLLNDYRASQDRLAETKEKYKQASGGITQRTRTLGEISEELERVKTDMDERGSSMTDGSPVVKIKQAIQRLKAEMVQMDIRTGVLEHILLQGLLRAKRDTQRDQEVDEEYAY